MTTFTAAYLVINGHSTLLTGPEHADLPEHRLREEALAEAERADIIDMAASTDEEAAPRITLAKFDASLEIGEWRE